MWMFHSFISAEKKFGGWVHFKWMMANHAMIYFQRFCTTDLKHISFYGANVFFKGVRANCHLQIWTKEKCFKSQWKESNCLEKKCPGGKNYYRHRRCPVNDSKSVFKRLSNHIEQVYKRIKRLSCLQAAIIEQLNRGGEYGSVQDLPHLGP